jgi:hypothetical protein
MQKLPKEIYFREIHKKDDPSAYALTKFSKYVMWILSLVGCVRPNNLVKNRFPLSDAPYSICNVDFISCRVRQTQ